MDDVILIDHHEALAEFATSARQAPWLGLDTEFVRDRTYFPKAGLIQVATADAIALIDPVVLQDLSPLAALLRATETVKIFHSSRQDLELLVRLFDAVPMPLFDTQVAAAWVGFAAQLGYSTLVSELLGRTTSPTLGRYPWLRRPLEPRGLAYASDDVAHLGALREELEQLLRERRLLDSFNESMTRLGEPALYRPDPAAAWRRIRGVQRLSGQELARLKTLAAWRESQAMREDRPRQWLVSDAALLAIARKAPQGGTALASIRALDQSARRRYGPAMTRRLRRVPTQESEPATDAREG